MFFIGMLLVTALLMEGIGTWISVAGIGALFAFDMTILTMIVILDVAKIVALSFLYQYWEEISWTMKAYLTAAIIVLVTISSAGDFGYLSAAFQRTVQPNVEAVLKVDALKLERDSVTTEKKSLSEQRNKINQQIASIPIKADEEGATSVRNRQRLISAFKPELDRVTKRLETVTTRADALSGEVLAAETASLEKGVHAGPIIYVAKAFSISIEDASKWIILVIISVFDPLAMMLVISANFLIKRRKPKTRPLNEYVDGLSDDRKAKLAEVKTKLAEVREQLNGELKDQPITVSAMHEAADSLVNQDWPTATPTPEPMLIPTPTLEPDVDERCWEGMPCYYCGELTEPLAGNPGRWPIVLSHRDEPGVAKYHHMGCVTDRLIENQPAPPAPTPNPAIELLGSTAPAWFEETELLPQWQDEELELQPDFFPELTPEPTPPPQFPMWWAEREDEVLQRWWSEEYELSVAADDKLKQLETENETLADGLVKAEVLIEELEKKVSPLHMPEVDPSSRKIPQGAHSVSLLAPEWWILDDLEERQQDLADYVADLVAFNPEEPLYPSWWVGQPDESPAEKKAFWDVMIPALESIPEPEGGWEYHGPVIDVSHETTYSGSPEMELIEDTSSLLDEILIQDPNVPIAGISRSDLLAKSPLLDGIKTTSIRRSFYERG